MNKEFPAEGYNILAGLGKEPATRLGISNMTISNLKS